MTRMWMASANSVGELHSWGSLGGERLTSIERITAFLAHSPVSLVFVRTLRHDGDHHGQVFMVSEHGWHGGKTEPPALARGFREIQRRCPKSSSSVSTIAPFRSAAIEQLVSVVPWVATRGHCFWGNKNQWEPFTMGHFLCPSIQNPLAGNKFKVKRDKIPLA